MNIKCECIEAKVKINRTIFPLQKKAASAHEMLTNLGPKVELVSIVCLELLDVLVEAQRNDTCRV